MAIDFPNSPPPESGDVYTGPNGVSYTFDGIKWIGQEMGSGGGGAGLPDQTGQAGKFLTTDGNGNASWADAQGPKGDTGEQGDVGPQGEQGEQGPPGVDALWNWLGAYSAGPQYQEGDIVTYEGGTYRRNNFSNSAMGFIPTNTTYWEYVAEKGDQGVRGEQGEPGAEGQQGLQGVPGQTGSQGAPGQKGDQGIPGNDGAQGVPGSPGAPGAAGAKGDPGDTGPRGEKGDQGVPGNDSTVPGPKGDTGDQGVSVTLQGTKATIADLPLTGSAGQGWIVTTGDGLTHLNGSLWFWNVSEGAWNDIGPIVGPQGDKGDPGDQGAKGDQGVPGNDGAPGADGAKGDTGETGPRGDPGLPGAKGDKGDQGEPGEPGQTGNEGPPGQQGEQGIQGVPGEGVSTGGTVGQVLAKLSSDDYDTGWIDQLSNIDRLTAGEYNVILGTDGVLTIPVVGDITRDGVSAFATRWDATPTVPGNNCPIFAELTPDHFYAYTQRSHIELDNDGHWYIGSNANATGLYGLDNDTTLYSSRGNVVIRTGENDLKYFTFDDNGALTFPDDTTQTTAWQGATITSDTAPTDALGRLWYNSTDGRTYVKYGDLWVDANPPVVPHVSTYLDGLVVEGTSIATTETDANITVQDVTFTADGRIQLPAGGDIVDSTGASVLNAGAVVKRSVEFPLGAVGDTRGTIALTPAGDTYICVADYQAPQDTIFTVVQSDIDFSSGSQQLIVDLRDYPELLAFIIAHESQSGGIGDELISLDGGTTWIDPNSYTGLSWYQNPPYLALGVDGIAVSPGTEFLIKFVPVPAVIWKRIIDVTYDNGDGSFTWSSPGDLTLETVRPAGYTGDCDVNIYAADDIFIEANGDDVNITASNEVIVNSDGGNFEWRFGDDGNLTIPGNIRKTTNASIVVGDSVVNFDVETVDELVPPGGVWRLFIDDGVYPNLGDIVQIGDTVTTAWGTPITATITEINQLDGEWRVQVAQDITVGFDDGPQTVTFSSVANKTWTFGQAGGLQFPDGTTQTTAFTGQQENTAISISASAPGSGTLWYNSTDGRTYVKYNNVWTDANPPVVAPASTYLSGLTIDEQTISSVDHANPDVKIGGNLLPDQDLTYDLGSPTNQWNSLHIKDTTIYMSGRALSLTSEGLKVDGGAAISVLDGGVANTWLLPV